MIKFKTERVEKEWAYLEEVNKPLHMLIEMLESFVTLELHKDVTLTSIFRSKEEQAALYVNVPSDKKVLDSPHMHWRAVDLRSSDFTDAEIKRMLTFLNAFRYMEGRSVALYHTIAGNVAHFHVQYRGQP